MMLQIAWKEYREHRSVWLAMAVIGSMLVIGPAVLLPALESSTSPQVDMVNMAMAAAGAVLTYGLVCGAMMFAGEREAGTLPFLEALTGRQFSLWRAKVAAGALFCVLQGLALAGVGLAVAPGSPEIDPLHGFWLLPLVALDAFVWGLLASGLCRSVLTAAGLAVVFWFTGVSVLVPCSFLGWPTMVVFRIGLLALALPCSAVLFGRTEPPRPSALPFVPPRLRPTVRPPAAWQVLLWLPFRQGWGLALVLALLSLPMGLVLLPAGPVWWLAFSLLVGVLCGTATLGSEQGDGSSSFLGNQRFPLGRIWAIKSAYWLAIAVAVLLLFVIVGVASHAARNIGMPKRDFIDHDTSAFAGSFLFTPRNWYVFAPLGLVYGFAVGQFYALIWRKSVVAVVVALLISPGIVGLWLPSVIWGGLPLWQVLLPPVLLLAATRLVLWDWASIGLRNWRPALTLSAGGLLAASAIAVALGYRVLEVPDVGEPFDTQAFQDSLPKLDENAGRKVLVAVGEMDKARRESKVLGPRQPLFPGDQLAPNTTFTMQAGEAIERGWPARKTDLDRWLDNLFQQEWVTGFRAAVALPLGVIDNPLALSLGSEKTETTKCVETAMLIEARALQLQARGADAEALEHLVVLLPLSRHMRNRAPGLSYYRGVMVQSNALRGLERWLANGKHNAQSVHRALDELTRHEAEVPPPSEAVKAEYARFRYQFDALPHELRPSGYSEMELEMASASWATPWEQQRQLRLANALCAAALKRTEMDTWQMAAAAREAADRLGDEGVYVRTARGCGLADLDGPGARLTPAQWGRLLAHSPLFEHLAFLGLQRSGESQHLLQSAMSLCRLRALRIVLALVLHEAERHTPARELQDLVRRGYLSEVPIDPFSGQPFLYRVSQGERISWPSETNEGEFRPREVAAGQGVVWSVGPDGIDHGGAKQASPRDGWDSRKWARQNLDLIFLVQR
jgi:hypothetical protein